MSIFNPNPQEIKIEAAHVAAIKEDAMQTWAAAMRADSKALEAEEETAKNIKKATA